MYSLEFLPLAMQDMVDIVSYISSELQNREAALRLSEKMIEAAESVTTFPYSNAVHATIRPLKKEYRKIIVNNYIMFYWVDEAKKCVTIVRVLYARRDYEKLL